MRKEMENCLGYISVRCTSTRFGESLCYKYHGAPHLHQEYAIDNHTGAQPRNIYPMSNNLKLLQVRSTIIFKGAVSEN